MNICNCQKASSVSLSVIIDHTMQISYSYSRN